MDWLYETGLPVWGQLVVLFVGCVLVGTIGYLAGHKSGAEALPERVEEALDHILLKRQHNLADRGRTTERRPEHEGQPASRNGRIKVTGARPGRPDHPSDQRI